jgi:nitrous oxidase accessory protein
MKIDSIHEGLTFRIAIGIMELVLLLAGSAGAATLTVNAGGGADYMRIQDAINNASAGDTILVYRGTYYENVNVNKQLMLSGIGNPVVDARGSGSAITLASDGNILEGFTVTGAGVNPVAGIPEAGIMVTSNNNTLSGNNASNNKDSGIYLSDPSNNNTLSGNNASNNNDGIDLFYSSKNTLTNNIMTGNKYNFGLWGNSYSGFNNWIDTSNLVDGKPVYYIKGATDLIYDSYTYAGTFYCMSCVNVTIKNLNLNKNSNGIFFWNTTRSKIQNVNASNNNIGIYLWSSSNNTLSGNNASNNKYEGILLDSSSSNMLSGNKASNNNHGIDLFYSSSNTMNSNNASNNKYEGILLYSSSSNTLSGNNASNNDLGIYLFDSSNKIYNNIFNNTNNIFFLGAGSNTWNTTRTPGTNIIGGQYLGGNFWAQPDGNGFSQTCPDNNKDGICDVQYALNNKNIDYLPLSSVSKPSPPPPVPEQSTIVLVSGGLLGILLVLRRSE